MKMQSIEDLLNTGMTYVLDFEQKTSKAAGKMAQAASDPEVKEMFQKTVTQGEKYRVSSYGSLTSYAKVLGKQDAVKELDQSLQESKEGDKKLTSIAETRINPQAAHPVAA